LLDLAPPKSSSLQASSTTPNPTWQSWQPDSASLRIIRQEIWDIAKDCRKAAANAEEEIFRLTDVRIGDIIEVFWPGPDSEL
jgi:hypothetical protein